MNNPGNLDVVGFFMGLFQRGFDFVIATGIVHPGDFQLVTNFAAFKLETEIWVSGDSRTEIGHHYELIVVGERQLGYVICSNHVTGVRVFACSRFHGVKHQAFHFCDVS